MPQLDAIRAAAIFLVMIQHWAPSLSHVIPWGGIGVRCFFVLSGFLITGILLRGRDLIDAGQTTRGFQTRQFYIRRSLRIFPIYYLTLIVGCAIGIKLLRDTFWWHAAYLSNFYDITVGFWPEYIGHLWSLSVEEQFYLLWPALIFLAPKRWLPHLFIVAALVAPVTRALIGWKLSPEHIATRVLLPCCFDALVIGSLLAWFAHRRRGVDQIPSVVMLRLAVASFIAMAGLRFLNYHGIAPLLDTTIRPTVEALFFVSVIGAAARGVSGPLGRVLDNPFLQYAGRISYGLYLYHMFAGYVGALIAKRVGLTFPVQEGPFRFVLLGVLTLAAAALSARFIEAPINNLKRRFPSAPQKPARETAIARELAESR
jgi:peptidoglycan/LPS O-acetylase OafA/YrhL